MQEENLVNLKNCKKIEKGSFPLKIVLRISILKNFYISQTKSDAEYN